MQRERSGELFLIAFTFIESWFPIVTILALQHITPIVAYAFTLVFSLLSFFAILFWKKQLNEFFKSTAYKDLFLTAFFMSVMFALIYIGLTYTTAGNMAVLIFLQFFFAFLYFNLFGNEKFLTIHLIGAFLMAGGAIIILFPEELTLNKGDLMILLAAALAPIANIYQKKARQQVSSETVLTFRTLVALPVLIILAIIFEPIPEIEQLVSALPYIAISGLLIMGLSKIFWVEAIHRISITKASAMAAFVPVFTLLFAYLVLNEIPDIQQMIGILPVLVGGFFITRTVSDNIHIIREEK